MVDSYNQKISGIQVDLLIANRFGRKEFA